MYVFKGFALHELLQNNAVGIINPIGELSTHSLTYSREKGMYVSAAAPNISLVSFQSTQDGAQVPVDFLVANKILDICNWVYTKTLSTGGPLFGDELLAQLLVAFQTTATDFKCGAIVNDGARYAPEWVSWKLTGYGDNFVRVWFSDPSFRAQYDEFSMTVIPPIDNLDDFFLFGTVVEDLLKSRSYSQSMEMIQAAKMTVPETIVRAETYDYHDPLVPSHLVPTNWSLLIYGQAGNNIDSIKDALVEYILTHSTHTRDEWIKILPDLFKRTEFTIVPLWDQFAIPNRILEAGIYSPIANVPRSIAIITRIASGYPGSHINANMSIMGNPYKSLAVIAVGGPENRDDKFKLGDVFPDYISVSSTSHDFNRMSAMTKAWVEILDRLIITAESMTEFTDIPKDMTRLKRNGTLYAVRTYLNVQYLVAAKANFPLP